MHAYCIQISVIKELWWWVINCKLNYCIYPFTSNIYISTCFAAHHVSCVHAYTDDTSFCHTIDRLSVSAINRHDEARALGRG